MALISVIIPTLNEAAWIERSIESVAIQPGSKEIIVADGGSVDETRKIASGRANVLRAERGRAKQCNTGARHAEGDILLFLHADTLLPRGAFRTIRHGLLETGHTAGAFRLNFDTRSPLLDFYAHCTRLPTTLICFGDRALFVRRETFEAVGGYPEQPIFEDLELARLLNRRGNFLFASKAVTTAARRFDEHGHVRQQLRNVLLWTYYICGGSPDGAKKWYRYDGAPGVEPR